MTPSRVLVLAAHPDDEVLGCGGTLRLLSNMGAETHVVFFTDGVGSRFTLEQDFKKEYLDRRSESVQAGRLLGISNTIYLQFPDNAMDSVALLDVAREIQPIAHEFRPEIVFCHHPGDVNVDHKRVSEAAEVVFRPAASFTPKKILYYEILSSTEASFSYAGRTFSPNIYVDISKTLSVKLAAFRCYGSEMRAAPHPRSEMGIETQARWRGLTVATSAAEAYALAREFVSA